MLIDAEGFSDAIEFDLVIVGSGLSGISLASQFTHKALRVCILESGDIDPSDFATKLCEGETKISDG